MQIRQIREGDAASFLELCRLLDAETQFMLLEPGERTTTVQQQHERIEAVLSAGNQNILLAIEAGSPVGFVAGVGGSYHRNRHCAHVVIGVLQAHAGRGVGRELLRELEAWARASRIRRLELTVMAHNVRAIRLYTAMGFEEEGIKRNSLVVDGRPVDELYMAKLWDV